MDPTEGARDQGSSPFFRFGLFCCDGNVPRLGCRTPLRVFIGTRKHLSLRFLDGDAMAEHSPYAVLGLEKGATDSQVKTAFVELVKKFDPERHTERFVTIQQAYNRLKDPRRRAKEDIHTYNVIKGEFLFNANERVAPDQAPGDEQVEEARSAYRKLAGDVAARERYIHLLMQRSSASVKRKDWADALKDWEEVLSVDPSHVRARHNAMYANTVLGTALAHSEFFEGAIEAWENALSHNPDNAELIHNLALVSERSGDDERAAKYWTEVVSRWKSRLDRESDNEYLRECIIEAHRYHGTLLENSGQNENRVISLNRYREVLKLNPDDFEAHMKVCGGLMDEGDWPEALKELTILARKHPRNVEVLNMLGWAQIQNNQADHAFLTWNKALQIDPKNKLTRESITEASMHLGRQYRERGIFTQALVCFKKLLRMQPDNPEALMEIGATYDMKGDKPAAMRAYEQVLERDPKNRLARKALNDLRLR